MPLESDLDEGMVGDSFSVGVLYPASSLKINAPVVNNVIILGFDNLPVPMVGGAMVTLTYMGYSKTLGWYIFNPTAGLKTRKVIGRCGLV